MANEPVGWSRMRAKNSRREIFRIPENLCARQGEHRDFRLVRTRFLWSGEFPRKKLCRTSHEMHRGSISVFEGGNE
jgi:hypothetical protein